MGGRVLRHMGPPPNRLALFVEKVASSKPAALFLTSVGSRVARTLLRVSKGRIGLAAGSPVLLLRTTGAETGQPPVTPLLYVEDGHGIIVVVGNGGRPDHPAWYRNLEAVVDINGRRRPVVARQAERAECGEGWRKATEMSGGYHVYQDRPPGRRSPVMVLERPDGPG